MKSKGIVGVMMALAFLLCVVSYFKGWPNGLIVGVLGIVLCAVVRGYRSG